MTPVLTITDLMARWKCSRRSILDKIHAGELVAFKVGARAFRVALVEVERVEQGRAA